jgi:hypothetical protein
MPIGQANQVGRTADGLALWALTVNGAEVPGRFIIVDGAFVEVQPAHPSFTGLLNHITPTRLFPCFSKSQALRNFPSFLSSVMNSASTTRDTKAVGGTVSLNTAI